jgi:hypothetical protein
VTFVCILELLLMGRIIGFRIALGYILMLIPNLTEEMTVIQTAVWWL